MQVIVYILGEYVPRTEDKEKAVEILNLLCDSWERLFDKSNTYGWIISAILKIHLSLNFEPNKMVDKIIKRFINSKETHLRQRWKEYCEIKAIKTQTKFDIDNWLFTMGMFKN